MTNTFRNSRQTRSNARDRGLCQMARLDMVSVFCGFIISSLSHLLTMAHGLWPDAALIGRPVLLCFISREESFRPFRPTSPTGIVGQRLRKKLELFLSLHREPFQSKKLATGWSQKHKRVLVRTTHSSPKPAFDSSKPKLFAAYHSRTR